LLQLVLPTTITISKATTPAMIQDAVAHKHGVQIGYEAAKKVKEKKKKRKEKEKKERKKNWLSAMIYSPKQLGLRNIPPTPRCDTYCRSGSNCDIGYGGP